jgi:hypothetical protein
MKNVDILLSNKHFDFNPGELDLTVLTKLKKVIKDKEYFDFIIDSKNAGFFYQQSIQIYSFNHDYSFNDIEYLNQLLTDEYKIIFEDLFSFGQDLFGNQFCFNKLDGKIVFFNVEIGDRVVIADNFLGWIEEIYKRFDYYVAMNLLESWTSNNKLENSQRLCPKKPFVIGGVYELNNLYAGTFPASLRAYSNIARQLYDLPDGTKIEIKIG